MSESDNTTVVIIGAPRSGTNMLRDVLTSLSGFGTWPCDEINYIWRHGNVRYASDALPEECARPRVKRYIQQRFEQQRQQQDVEVLVEKTCANSLRVPFVRAVVPHARYLFIYRDGIDATGSAQLRWTAKLDLPYILAKARFVPRIDLPYYAFRYFFNRIYRLLSREKRLAFWGPKLDNMESVLQGYGVNEICALQWQQCIESADRDLRALPGEQLMRIRYEDFVQEPAQHVREILQWLGREVPQDGDVVEAVKKVSARSVGKGHELLGAKEADRVRALIGDTLRKFDYV